MAIELDQVGKWLEAKEMNFHHDNEKGLIIFAAGDKDSTQSHFIRAKDDGSIFEWNMQILDGNRDNVVIKDHEHAPKVISHMLYMNYTTKFGTWEYDPSDGDIRLAIEIPLEDALMTEKQFDRVFGYMTRDGQDGAENIRHILNTGEVKKDDSDAEMISKLEAMLAILKSDDTASSEEGI